MVDDIGLIDVAIVYCLSIFDSISHTWCDMVFILIEDEGFSISFHGNNV